MAKTLYTVLAIMGTGADCPATEAWYRNDAVMHMPTLRAAAHYKALSAEQAEQVEVEMEAHLGGDVADKWFGWPAAVTADYKEALERAADRLAS